MNKRYMDTFDVPFDRPGNYMDQDAVTHVRVIVMWHPSAHDWRFNRPYLGGYRALFRPIERRFGFETNRTAFESWNQFVEEAPKFDRKTLLAVSGRIRAQMEARKGWAWDVVKGFCARHKGVLYDSPERVREVFGVDDRLPDDEDDVEIIDFDALELDQGS